MGLAKRVLLRLIEKMYVLKVSTFAKLFGIDYVSQEIAHCRTRHVATLLKRYGASLCQSARFKGNVHIDHANGHEDPAQDFSNLCIGERCRIGRGVSFDLSEMIVIEGECIIDAGARFITHANVKDRPMSKWYPPKAGRITVGYGSWIGADAVLLSGVTLGACCVAEPGSVVTQSFPAYSVVTGSPARLVRVLQPQEEKSALLLRRQAEVLSETHA